MSVIAPPSFDIQGHRGARGLLPENTIPAFMKALELGTPTLEMDVVISADEHVVLSHDPWFARALCRLPDGRPIPFHEARRHRLFALTYEEIAKYEVGGIPHPGFPEQQAASCAKPLLRDVIAKSEDRARELGRAAPFYSIETKSRRRWEGRYHPDPETFTRLVLDVVLESGVAERTILQSFDMRTLHVARGLDAGVRLSLLRTRRAARGVGISLRRLGFVPDIYSPDHRAVTEALIEAAHRHGMKVIPWTVNEVRRMRALREMGCDGLITDYPDRAMANIM